MGKRRPALQGCIPPRVTQKTRKRSSTEPSNQQRHLNRCLCSFLPSPSGFVSCSHASQNPGGFRGQSHLMPFTHIQNSQIIIVRNSTSPRIRRDCGNIAVCQHIVNHFNSGIAYDIKMKSYNYVSSLRTSRKTTISFSLGFPRF